MKSETQRTTETKEKKVRRTQSIPKSQYDLLSVAEKVADRWSSSPKITLIWITSEEFKSLVEEYKAGLNQRALAGSGRGSYTQKLREYDEQINLAVEEVKVAIAAKFGREKSKAYYSEFGIVKYGQSYRLPGERSLRVIALSAFTKSIKLYDLKVAGFSSEWFSTLAEDYASLYQSAKSIDNAVSASVGNKNSLRERIEDVLTALMLVIKANYPRTYEAELRNWGFQREK